MNAPPFGGGGAATEAEQALGATGHGTETRNGTTEAQYGSTASQNGSATQNGGATDPDLAPIRRESSRAAADLMRLSGDPRVNGDVSSRRVIYQQVLCLTVSCGPHNVTASMPAQYLTCLEPACLHKLL